MWIGSFMIGIKDTFGDAPEKQQPDRRDGSAREHADEGKVREKGEVRKRGSLPHKHGDLHDVVDDRRRDIDGKIAHPRQGKI